MEHPTDPPLDRRVEGAWHLRDYVVSGAAQPIDGLLLFAAGLWTTVFFVGAESPSPFGSGEGGEYVQDGDRLTFTHRFTVQVQDGRPPLLLPRNDRVEPCRIALEAASLAIEFPSGNVLRMVRESRS